MKAVFEWSLLIISVIVAIGLSLHENMWLFIALYWIVLAAKNIEAMVREKCRESNSTTTKETP